MNDKNAGKIIMEMSDCNKYQYDISVKIASILASIICLIPINALIISLIHNHVDADFFLKTTTMTGTDSLVPEQAERMQYLASSLLFPVFCFVSFQLFSKIFKKIRSIQTVYLNLSIFAFASISILSIFGMRAAHFFYLSKSTFFIEPAANFIFLGFMLIFLLAAIKNEINKLFQKALNWIIDILSICLIFTVTIWLIFGKYGPFINEGQNFIAYFHSVVQVFFGKTLLVDLTNQYGLYPYFLELIFKAIGLSTFNFSIVMGVFLGVAFLCIYITLRKLISNRIIAFCGFASVVFFQKIFYGLTYNYPDPYYQYNPHRLIFPSVFVLSACIYFFTCKPKIKKLLYNLIFILGLAAIFWNLDTGIIVYVAWVIVLIYKELIYLKSGSYGKLIKKCFAHLGYAIAYFLIALIIFVIFTYIRSGSFPNISEAFRYQIFFYRYGSNALPMKLIHPWNLIILCYILGLYESIRIINSSSNNKKGNNTDNNEDSYGKEKIIFLLSILGIGLFSYYQNRSHNDCLTLVWWPAFILLTIYVDDIYIRISSYFKINKGRKKWLGNLPSDIVISLMVFLILFSFLASSVANIFNSYPLILNLIKESWALSQKNESTDITRNADFVNSNINHGEQVFIISKNAAIYYLKSQTVNPVKIPAFIELVFKSDYENIIEYIKKTQDEKIFIDTDFLDQYIIENLFKYFTPAAISENKKILLFKNKRITKIQKEPLPEDITFKNGKWAL